MFSFCEVYSGDEIFVGGIKCCEVYFIAVEDGEEYVNACDDA